MAHDETPFVRWLWERVRERPDLTQNALAEEIGVSSSMLSTWLNGKQLPQRKSERKLARWAGVPVLEIHRLVADSASPAPAITTPRVRPIADIPGLAPDLQELLRQAASLSPDNRAEVLRLVRLLHAEDENRRLREELERREDV